MEREIYILVFSLMFLGLLGLILNNIVFISLHDNPYLPASTPNVLLDNLSLSHLILSFVLFTFTTVYVSYGHATSSHTVDIVFCDYYTFLHQTAMAVLPLTLFFLSWHIFLAGRSCLLYTSAAADE